MTAECPNCGGSVTFRFDKSVQNTCPYCRSILVRSGLDVHKVGQVAELPPHVSPIQLGSEGQYRGQAFSVTGRILYQWEQGGWNEWHIMLSDGTSAWLSDAQAQYAVSRQAPPQPVLQDPQALRPGNTLDIAGKPLQVSTLTQAHYSGVEGELPFEYWDKSEVLFIDLKSADGRFATVDYSESPPLVFVGEYVEFDSLRMTNLRDASLDTGAAVRAGALSCPNCGAAIELRAEGQAVATVCGGCQSVLDATTPELRIVQKLAAMERVEPLIPLGRTGRLNDEIWQVIGFQTRHIDVDGERYAWREYVLFHRIKGFRYLTEYNGHWNDVRPINSIPAPLIGARHRSVVWMNETFKHFQTATAITAYVSGEFPWRVQVGEQAQVEDFIAPPRVLSSEGSAQEITWSVGDYVTGADIWKAFDLPGTPPAATGIYANQPSPYAGSAKGAWGVAGTLVALLLVSWFLTMVLAADKTVFQRAYTFYPGLPGEASFVTPAFDLEGRTSNVQVKVESDIANNWLYFNFALINDGTGQAFDWGREVSYYFGRDSDGNWSEGGRNDQARIGHVPAGRYYLRVEPEWSAEGAGAAAAQPVHYTLTVKRDVPLVWPYLVVIPLLLLPAVFLWARGAIYETNRWSESDYGGSSSDSSSSSDD